VLEEQKRVLGDSKTVEHDQVKQMEYLEACIRESLRTTAFLRTFTRHSSFNLRCAVMHGDAHALCRQSDPTGWR
jgi:hypothetical protein